MIDYQPPTAAFFPAVMAMVILTDLCFFHGPDFSADEAGSSFANIYYRTLVKGVMDLGLFLFGGNFNVIAIITVSAHIIHFFESAYAAYLCMANKVGLGTSLMFIYGTAFGGICQLSPLRRALRNVKKRQQKKE